MRNIGPYKHGMIRRDLLKAAAAALLVPVPRIGAEPKQPLRILLDRASRSEEPAQRLAVLRSAGTRSLGRADRAVLRMIVRGLEREGDLRRRFPFGKADGSSPYAVSHRHGAYLQARAGIGDVAQRIDEESDRLRAEAARGIVPPLSLIESVLVAQRALDASGVRRDVRAALVRQSAALERLRTVAAPAPGVWRLPGGGDYYALRLRCTTGADDPPIDVERRVGDETRRLLARADRLLAGLGLSRGSVGSRLRALKGRAGHLYSNDEPGRSRAVADMNSALARLRPHLPERFSPPLELRSSVRRMSPADERAARRGYRDPPTASGPGAYYPDLSALQERPGWTLTTVAYHETVPGHLLQLGHQEAADPHPLQVRYAPGYSEGWAIYAEGLADDMGLFSPVEQLGFIQSILFRLARVTADIGIHLRRWERARAIHYLEETVGFELFFPFAVEVDRYSAEPGAFAGDAMVALTLGRLGRRAGASGPGRLRAFHDSVLSYGPLSAQAIERIVGPSSASPGASLRSR
jgi:uncharacterized protein (DUF885 family)